MDSFFWKKGYILEREREEREIDMNPILYPLLDDGFEK